MDKGSFLGFLYLPFKKKNVPDNTNAPIAKKIGTVSIIVEVVPVKLASEIAVLTVGIKTTMTRIRAIKVPRIA